MPLGEGRSGVLGGVWVCCWKRKVEQLSWRGGEAVAEGAAVVLFCVWPRGRPKNEGLP